MDTVSYTHLDVYKRQQETRRLFGSQRQSHSKCGLYNDYDSRQRLISQRAKLRDGKSDVLRRDCLLYTSFATSVAKHLEKLNATEIQTLQEAAILFSRSPQGAAIIATNIHAVEDVYKRQPKYLFEETE